MAGKHRGKDDPDKVTSAEKDKAAKTGDKIGKRHEGVRNGILYDKWGKPVMGQTNSPPDQEDGS